jgi:mono/diheme cytochrome c family protein
VARIAQGADRCGQYCAACHGANGQPRGASFPDLTRTTLLPTQEGFDQVVLKGGRVEKGIVFFASTLCADDAAAIWA